MRSLLRTSRRDRSIKPFGNRLRVPHDIAVVGVGDIALGDLLKVPLTTISWSRKDQGLNAAELLLNGLDNDEKDAPRRVIIPPRLVVRESSGSHA